MLTSLSSTSNSQEYHTVIIQYINLQEYHFNSQIHRAKLNNLTTVPSMSRYSPRTLSSAGHKSTPA